MKVNGVCREYPSGLTVADLLSREGFREECVAVEVNEKIVSKEVYRTTAISDTDVVEVVSFMGGG